MVRELAERGVLSGERGAYICRRGCCRGERARHGAGDHRRAHRPARPAAKRTLSAAAVIGSRFGTETADRAGHRSRCSTTCSRRADRSGPVHPDNPSTCSTIPLIRAVAYESQLKSDRAELHRRLAAAIEARDPESADENAALIAEHLEAAGDLHAAYGWHMRAAAWATNRDIAAARLSWERARKIADALPADDPDRAAMRIAPRTMLCGIAWRVHVNVAGARFDELRELCTAAGDKASLAIGMAGLVIDHAFRAGCARRRSWHPKPWPSSSRSAIRP